MKVCSEGGTHATALLHLRFSGRHCWLAITKTPLAPALLCNVQTMPQSARLPPTKEKFHGVGRGCGVGRGLGVTLGVAVGVAVGVTVEVAVGVAVGVGVPVAVAVGVGVGVDVGVAVGVVVGVAVVVGVGVAVGVEVGVGVGVGVGPEGVMLKGPLVEELFWKRRSLATTRRRTSGMPEDAGSCQS
jgi:hypothetical protein